MEVIIRRADGLDISEISHLLIGWLEEAEFNYPGYCEYSPVWLADFIYKNVAFVGLSDGKIIGAIGLKLANFPWNNEIGCIFCDFLMINKDHRSNGIATLLIAEAKKLAVDTCKSLHLGIMSGRKAELKDRFLEMNGFMYSGGNFCYFPGSQKEGA